MTSTRPTLLANIANTSRRFLAEGMSPEKLAMAVALGITCGLFPVFGATTAVTALAGLVFKANPVVVQVFNYAMYPIYFFVEFAFIAVGAWLFEGNLHAYTPQGLRALFDAGWGAMLGQGARALGQGIIVWLVLSPFAVIALRRVSLHIILTWQNRPRGA